MQQLSTVSLQRDNELGTGDVHIWAASLDEPAARYNRFLSPAERQTAARFRYEKDRQQYVVSHGILREILGGYLDAGPATIEFLTGSHGKPDLKDDGGCGIRFNISHSRDRVLVAVTLNTDIGVDIEYMRDIDEMAHIVERFCAGHEKTELWTVPDDMKKRAFYLCWTRKEAFIKATGEGMARPLDSFAVSLTPGKSAELIELDGSPGETTGWAIADIPCHPEYSASYACRDRTPRVTCFTWRAGNH